MYKVIDLETTGLKSNDEIAQLAIWTLDDKLNPVSYSNDFFAITDEMPEEVYRVNHLTKKILHQKSGGVKFVERADEFKGMLQGNILIAHNAAFERRLLGYHLNHALDNEQWICTMLRYTPTLALKDHAGNSGYKQCNLRELTNYCIQLIGLTYEDLTAMYERATGLGASFHDALFDTYCTALDFNILG